VRFTAIFPGEPGLASFIGAKDCGSGGDNWSYNICKAPVKLSPPAPNFLQTGCPFCPACAGSGVERIDTLRFLARCRKRQLRSSSLCRIP